MITLEQALQWIPGARLVGASHPEAQRVHTDTRTLQAGDLFVALQGDNFDAHDFLPQARAQGAVAAIATHGLEAAGLPGLEVADTREALGALARGWRSQFDLPLVAVSGSNGKTTVTQMIAAIFQAHAGNHALATQGNLNNDIGVPLTLLRLRAHHQIAVIEMGMNHPGEIAQLATIAQPTVALVNNAQREHQEFMTSVEAVAQENGASIAALSPEGIAVFPADDAYTLVWQKLADKRQTLSFSLDGPADITAHAEWRDDHAWHIQAQTPAGDVAFQLHMAGRHNAKNALAAFACAQAAGVPLTTIAQGLESFQAVRGRSQMSTLQLSQAVTLIDDTYNANPDSVRAAIDVLAQLSGPRLLVLGDMGEVGDQGLEFHREVGTYAAQQGIEQLFCLGPLSQQSASAFPGGQHFSSIEALNAALQQATPAYRSVLIKGSRFMKMERAVQALQALAKEHTHAA